LLIRRRAVLAAPVRYCLLVEHASAQGRPARRARGLLYCGLATGPLFVTTFLADGATWDGYRPSRHPSSLAASGTLVPAIARLVAADEDTVRDVIHLFNAKGLAALDPQWAGGRPRLISDEAIEVIVTAARTRPEKLGRPFTRWSLRKLAAYLAGRPQPVVIGRERLRQILHARGISFQRTRGRTRRWRRTQPPAGPGDVPRARSGRGTQPPRRTVILHLSQPPGPQALHPGAHPRAGHRRALRGGTSPGRTRPGPPPRRQYRPSRRPLAAGPQHLPAHGISSA
jgi:transposase